MRTLPLVVAAMLTCGAPAWAQEPNRSIQGFGGLQLGTLGTTDATFGGVVAGNLTPGIQVLGEAGRIGNVLPSTIDSLLRFSPIGFSVSAWYAQGGVRLTTSNSSAVRPYLETSAGFARLRGSYSDFDTGRFDILTDIALRFLDRTEPLATVGGGVTFESGPLLADVGYRYRRIFSSGWLDTLAMGGTLHTNEVRMGLGVRF